MPKASPISRDLHQRIADDIAAGLGRNAIARKYRVAAGTVTNIARAESLWFENDWMTTTGTEARRIDCEAARLEKEERLVTDLLNLPHGFRERDGRETKARRRLTYALYDLQRHHS